MKKRKVLLALTLFAGILGCVDVQGGRIEQRKRADSLAQEAKKQENPSVAVSSKISAFLLDTLNYNVEKNEVIDTVAIGDLIIPVITNPSTGFDWTYAIEGNSAVVVLDTIITEKEKTPPMMMGAPLYKRYCFKANQSGEAVIKFRYERVWESKEEPIAEGVYKIIVKEPCGDK